jgi:hypothetical protein
MHYYLTLQPLILVHSTPSRLDGMPAEGLKKEQILRIRIPSNADKTRKRPLEKSINCFRNKFI